MSARIESRSGEVDTERCVNAIGGRYDLSLLAAQHLRELKKQARETRQYVTAIDALKDVQTGAVDLSVYIDRVK
jgi:hypothetical protein